MTDSKTPEWVKEEAEKLAKESVREAFRDPLMPMYIPMVPMLSQALLSAYERGRKEGIEEAAKVVLDYPPDGFNAALYERTERRDYHDPFWTFEGDTGNLAGLMGEVLKPYATAIRQLLEVKG